MDDQHVGSPVGWRVPLPPDSLPTEVMAAIGQMALRFAFAENALKDCLIVRGFDPKKIHDARLKANLERLSKSLKTLSQSATKMQELAHRRNTMMHGFLSATVSVSGENLGITVHNPKFGSCQTVEIREMDDLGGKAVGFAIEVIISANEHVQPALLGNSSDL